MQNHLLLQYKNNNAILRKPNNYILKLSCEICAIINSYAIKLFFKSTFKFPFLVILNMIPKLNIKLDSSMKSLFLMKL